MSCGGGIALRLKRLPRGLAASVTFLLFALVHIAWMAPIGGLVQTLLSALFLSLAAIAWLAIWIFATWLSFKEDWNEERWRFAVTLLSAPIALLLFYLLTMPVTGAAHYFATAKYESMLADDQFRSQVAGSESDFDFDGSKVLVDRLGTQTRLAFDVDGYVVRASGYLYDPSGDADALSAGKSGAFGVYEISYCRYVRQYFYRCSFT